MTKDWYDLYQEYGEPFVAWVEQQAAEKGHPEPDEVGASANGTFFELPKVLEFFKAEVTDERSWWGAQLNLSDTMNGMKFLRIFIIAAYPEVSVHWRRRGFKAVNDAAAPFIEAWQAFEQGKANPALWPEACIRLLAIVGSILAMRDDFMPSVFREEDAQWFWAEPPPA